MVISRCVPMQISRKRFSDFSQHEQGQLYLVGYSQTEQGIRKNTKIPYGEITNQNNKNYFSTDDLENSKNTVDSNETTNYYQVNLQGKDTLIEILQVQQEDRGKTMCFQFTSPKIGGETTIVARGDLEIHLGNINGEVDVIFCNNVGEHYTISQGVFHIIRILHGTKMDYVTSINQVEA